MNSSAPSSVSRSLRTKTATSQVTLRRVAIVSAGNTVCKAGDQYLAVHQVTEVVTFGDGRRKLGMQAQATAPGTGCSATW